MKKHEHEHEMRAGERSVTERERGRHNTVDHAGRFSSKTVYAGSKHNQGGERRALKLRGGFAENERNAIKSRG
jgi:hypothetical protein